MGKFLDKSEGDGDHYLVTVLNRCGVLCGLTTISGQRICGSVVAKGFGQAAPGMRLYIET